MLGPSLHLSTVFLIYPLYPDTSGEVFVLDDGGEVDLDLGNYERFMDTTLSRDHNLTTGQIYKDVIERERKGEFLGKTVQGVKSCGISRITFSCSAHYKRNPRLDQPCCSPAR